MKSESPRLPAIAILPVLMNCPSCDAVISSRRSGKCGVCGEALPPELLFTDEQRKKLETQMVELERNHRASLDHMNRICDHARSDTAAPRQIQRDL